MTTARKRTVTPSNTSTAWRVYLFVINELDQEARDRGFRNITSLVNFILAAYFNDEVLERQEVDINSIDLSSMATIQTTWRIRSKSYNGLRQDTKILNYKFMSELANNILLRYVLGQRIKRCE